MVKIFVVFVLFCLYPSKFFFYGYSVSCLRLTTLDQTKANRKRGLGSLSAASGHEELPLLNEAKLHSLKHI